MTALLKPYAIMSDSSLDLPDSRIKELDITVVPFLISFDGHTYKKEREEIPTSEVYQKMVDHPDQYARTSMPAATDYLEKMEVLLADKLDIICICMSGKLTSSCQSALLAARMIQDKYPERQIEVIDSTLATALQGMYVEEACRLRDSGIPFAQAVERLHQIKSTGNIFFTIGSLDYLIHGGRIGKLAGTIAQTIKLKPMVSMKEGELFPLGVARTRHQSMKKMISAFFRYLDDSHIDLAKCRIATGFGWDRAEGETFYQMFKEAIEERYGYAEPFMNYQIGVTIGVHTGPHPLGIGILEKAV